jgi:[CysO sulfur-carrier protein]-S-L-cysteine hydrolase
MRIARELYDQMIEHARAEAPQECCGMLAARGDSVVDVYPVNNVEKSSLRFVMDPQEQFNIYNKIESDGLDVVIYHSHPRTEPKPSQTDIGFAREWPGVLWAIIGLGGEEAQVRLWQIDDGQVIEAEFVAE